MIEDSDLQILLVDDNPDDVQLIRRQLEREFSGVTIEQASAPEQFKRAIDGGRFNLVITDFQLQWSDGLAVLRAVKARFPYRPVIMFTATGTQEIAVEALKSGLDDYIIKAPKHYVRLLASVRTVLEHTEVERRAADLQVRLEHLLSRVDVGVFRAVPGGRVVECNAAFLRLLNADSLESARDIFARDFGPLMGEAHGTTSDHQAPARRETRNSGPQGEQWFLIDEVLTTTSDGHVYVDGLVEEITERKQMEHQRVQLLNHEQTARHEAEALSRMKDEFLAVISHELRTPLTSILGWAALLRSGAVTDQRAITALATIERNAQAQKHLIDDLIDVSGIVTGTVRLNQRQIDAVSPVEAAIAALRPVAEVKSVHLRAVIDRNTCSISADPDRLQQIVCNLVDNAIKFTDTGGSVEVRLESDHEWVQIIVSDTGIGIRPDFLPFVFDRFRQADSKMTRARGGLGLGLAIVHHLVQMMGGSVRAGSDGEGKGARFSVRFPVLGSHKLSAPVPTAESEKRFDGLSVLVVDDNPDTCDLLKTMLEERGAAVTAVTSAVAAIEKMDHGGFDLLVSDIAMPGMDGYQLIRSVRGLPDRAGKIPAIAITAYSRAEDRARALGAGYQQFIGKPVKYDELMSVIANLV